MPLLLLAERTNSEGLSSLAPAGSAREPPALSAKLGPEALPSFMNFMRSGLTISHPHMPRGPMHINVTGKAAIAKTAAKKVTANRTVASFMKILTVQKKRKKLDPSVVTAEPTTALVIAFNEWVTAAWRRAAAGMPLSSGLLACSRYLCAMCKE
mmetsp:Transcript_30520/g.87528  ORF Transcript_30520/g.87528 Transcript_30520/m.87528 type:complete len:154 (+) Transcript_30520:942-1403(+)